MRELLESAPAVAPGLAHEVDGGVAPLAETFARADVLVCDVSGVAMDWLATGRPIIVTLPAGPVTVAQSELTDVVPRLAAHGATATAELVDHEISADPLGEERARLKDRYLGDTSPGASIRRFVEACEKLMEIRDREVARINAGELPA
ncbi:hypothetical protein [Paraoerskovia sediminicola]|uniref:hypothetical protein n=1 Tax=Paraoerskovia sediminicola TaxID=1138587 RepID=UPI0025743AC3|nr:hypothetical protein [Paraoerskovia sediminicola]